MVTLSPPNKLSSAYFITCSNFQIASISLKVCENVSVSKRLDPGETPSYSSGSKLFAYGTMVAVGRIKVNSSQIINLVRGQES